MTLHLLDTFNIQEHKKIFHPELLRIFDAIHVVQIFSELKNFCARLGDKNICSVYVKMIVEKCTGPS